MRVLQSVMLVAAIAGAQGSYAAIAAKTHPAASAPTGASSAESEASTGSDIPVVPFNASSDAGNIPVSAFVAAPTIPDLFVLRTGQSLEGQLMDWAKRSGWSVTWNTPDDWIVPHDSTYTGGFEEAVTSVFKQASEDGGDLHVDIWRANKVVVVEKTGATQ